MTKNILVIEDDHDTRETLKQILETNDFRVFVSKDGKLALEFLKKSRDPISLILLDIQMPTMDGYSFRRYQEEDPRIASIPVVVMTGDPNIEFVCLRLGARGFLRKPFNLDQVLNTVKRLSGIK